MDKSAVQRAGRILTAGAEAWLPPLRILPGLLPHHVPLTLDPCALASPCPGSILSLRSRRWWRERRPIPAPGRRSNGERRPRVPRPPCGHLQPSGSPAQAPAGVPPEPVPGLRARVAAFLASGTSRARKKPQPRVSAWAGAAAGAEGPAPGPSSEAPRRPWPRRFGVARAAFLPVQRVAALRTVPGWEESVRREAAPDPPLSKSDPGRVLS